MAVRAAVIAIILSGLAGCVTPAPSPTPTTSAPAPSADGSASPTVYAPTDTGGISPTFFATPNTITGTFEPVHVTHAFAGGATEERTFDVPSSAGRLVLQMAIAGADLHACDRPNSATLALSDPFGKRYATLEATRTDFRSAPGTCDHETVTATLDAGTWTVAFSGIGPVEGRLDLVAS